jgi:hypothetical protein
MWRWKELILRILRSENWCALREKGDVSNACRQMAKAFADLTVEPVAVAVK